MFSSLNFFSNSNFRIAFLLFFIYSFVFGQKNTDKKIYFNGIYETECDFINSEEGEKSFIRFYPDHQVITAGTVCDATIDDVKVWFNLDSKNVSVGKYQLKNNKISFFSKSKEGTVKYKGKISKDGILNVRLKSLINGFRNDEKYQFTEIKNLK